jgi:uncharacterized membrane protein
MRMNKEVYLKKLSKNLANLPEEEIDDIIMDFDEYFDIGKERGRSEEELSSSLGDPKKLARQIKAESYIKKAEESTSAGNIARAIFTSIGLSFFNIIFILPPFLVVFIVVIVLFAVSVVLGAAGITGMIGSFFYPLYSQYLTFTINPFVGVFAFLGLGAFGILFFTGNIYLWKIIYRQVVRYLRFNLSIISGRRKQDEI